jgi:undecaprenyl-diphosphatase
VYFLVFLANSRACGGSGLTEFLPVSSSGHLILVPYFTGWPDQGGSPFLIYRLMLGAGLLVWLYC